LRDETELALIFKDTSAVDSVLTADNSAGDEVHDISPNCLSQVDHIKVDFLVSQTMQVKFLSLLYWKQLCLPRWIILQHFKTSGRVFLNRGRIGGNATIDVYNFLKRPKCRYDLET